MQGTQPNHSLTPSFFSRNPTELSLFLQVMRTNYDQQTSVDIQLKEKLFAQLRDRDIQDEQIRNLFVNFIRYIYRFNPQSEISKSTCNSDQQMVNFYREQTCIQLYLEAERSVNK